MSERRPPKMARSRGQLTTVYAPHSLFTFEGGTGACMARPVGNRAYEPASSHTKRMIHEQIVEFTTAWLLRATTGRDTVVSVVPQRGLDQSALRDGQVHLPIGMFHFQVPERVAYVPFPLAFVCTRCDLHRTSEDPATLTRDADRFRDACPSGRANCANDWQQMDVVMAHWSGAVEPLTPARRRANPTTHVVETFASCETCGDTRFYLRRGGNVFSRWRFDCVECATPREIRLADRQTLEVLKGPLLGGANLLPQINMEAVSYRASATFYSQGDRLLVFGNDQWLTLLQAGNATRLATFLASAYGFPAPTLANDEKERLLRDAGRGDEWDEYFGLLEMMQELTGPAADKRRGILQKRVTELEVRWQETVFVSASAAPSTLAALVTARERFVRRYDPVRMSVEHRTLVEEHLRAGSTLPDGRLLSVDVTRPDDFLVPDPAHDTQFREVMCREVQRRLHRLGIEEMRLLRGLQLCEYSFGYTRTCSTPTVQRDKAGSAEMPVRLNLFAKVPVGDSVRHPVLCLEQTNEAFYVRLKESVVTEWLRRNTALGAAASDATSLGGRLLEEYPSVEFSRFLDEYRRERAIARSPYPLVYTLLHTLAHHFICTVSGLSGLDLGSFGEHIFLADLAIVVYRRGMTLDLGNLSSMWRDAGDAAIGNEVLERMATIEGLRCGSESVCTHHGGACPDCILIPETACITRNELLSRSVLVGRGFPRWLETTDRLVGYYDVAADGLRQSRH